ncbi:MAG: 3-oxoacyl-ACP reductase family protein [Thermomicrobiales bacterium]
MTALDVFKLAGRTALVTGGGRGLGRAIALALADAGADVWISYRESAASAQAVVGEIAARGRRAGAFQADVREEAGARELVAATLADAGQIDILVNNAGILNEVPLVEMSTATWDDTIATNLRSVFLCTREVLPGMLARQSGAIINVASQLGLKGGANCAHYAASKGAILAFTKSVAREVGPQGIRVNAIAPGPLVSPMTDDLATPEWVANKLRSQILPRMGTVEEVAATAVFLASDAAALYLGQTLSPNAGGVM